jgi:hypothetical protein
MGQDPEGSSPHSQQPATGPCPETVLVVSQWLKMYYIIMFRPIYHNLSYYFVPHLVWNQQEAHRL